MSKLLETLLKPFLPYFRRKDITEICVNQPGEVWLETLKGWERKADKAITLRAVLQFASSLATEQGQRFSPRIPLLATRLPGFGFRVMVMGETITASGCAMSIRVAHATRFPLEDYFPGGTEVEDLRGSFHVSDNPTETLIRAIAARRNILIAGGTSSGKTTFLNSLIQKIPNETRLIVIEDTQELVVDQPNHVRILKSKTGTDVAGVTYPAIINACMRMRPDSLLLGEFDIENTMPFLRLLNTGHGGSMATIHANSARGALKALVKNATLSISGSPEAVEGYARDAFDLVAFCTRLSRGKYGVSVTEVSTL